MVTKSLGLTAAGRAWYSLFLSQVSKMLLSPTHVARKSQASWREVSVWERNAKRNTHHLWRAVCTLIWSSDCLSHIHPSTGLYGYSHNFKICSNSQVALALSHPSFEMDVFCTLFMMGLGGKSWTSLLSALVFRFPMCTWSSSLQRFPVQSGLKDSAVQLDVCSQNRSVKDEQSVSSAKGEHEIQLLLCALCQLKGGARSSGFVQGVMNSNFLLISAKPVIQALS